MAPENAPSIALLDRVDMRREAHFMETLRFKGAWADDIIYGMLKSEYEESLAQLLAGRMLNLRIDYLDILKALAIYSNP